MQAFIVAVFIIFSMYGGGFAVVPALLADLFGKENVGWYFSMPLLYLLICYPNILVTTKTTTTGAVHGVILTAWSAAGAVGPILITSIRNNKLAHLSPGDRTLKSFFFFFWWWQWRWWLGLITTNCSQGKVRPTSTTRLCILWPWHCCWASF